jgi:type I restriction enzyme, S subunit
MSADWPELSIDALKASSKNAIAMGPFGSRIKAENFVETGVPIIKGGNLNGDFLLEDKFSFLTEEKATELKTSNAFRRDIVITHRGTIGQVGIVPDDSNFDRYVVSQSQLKVTLDQDKVNPYFVYYFLRSPLGQHRLLMNASQVGVPAIAQASTSVKGIMVPCPDKGIQDKIVEMLLNLDHKIELNRQTNQTLEHIAQAIFKSWFVDFEPTRAKIAAKQIAQARQDSERSATLKAALFADGRWPEAVAAAIAEGDPERAAMAAISGKSLDEIDQLSPEQKEQLLTTAALFPDALVDSELGEIPEGWAISSLKYETSKIGSGATPRGGKGAYKEEGISQIRSMNVFDGNFIMKELAKIDEAQAEKLKNVIIEKNDVLLNITGASVTRCCIVPPSVIPARVNQHVCIIRAKDKSMNPYYIYQSLTCPAGKSVLNSLAQAGATREALTKAHIENFELVVPDEKVISSFGQVAEKLEEMRFRLTEENSILTKIRDTLLPKLLGGELEPERGNIREVQVNYG